MDLYADFVPEFEPTRPIRKAKVFLAALATLAVGVVALFGAAYGLGLVHFYDAQNAGVSIGVDCGWNIGLEVRGNPGFYTNSCG